MTIKNIYDSSWYIAFLEEWYLGQTLDDALNNKLLQLICSGEGVEINISELSERLMKHRNTIASRVENLFSNRI
ncbi:MAG: hypothetical protein ACFE7R_08400, partial [Candidatus Hodarchaeota archaeon]